MIGMLLWKDPTEGRRQKTIQITGYHILHMRFLCAEVLRGARTPEAVLRRRVLSAARRLRKSGIMQIVLPEKFPYTAQLEKAGVRAVSTLSLRRALAAELVRIGLEHSAEMDGGVRVAVSGEHLTGELVHTVTELALRYRYVLLDLPYGGEEFCRQLRREYGVSVLLSPAKEQMESAEALILFRERTDLQKNNPVVLALYEGGAAELPPLTLPPHMEEQLPDGVCRPQLLSALLAAGVLRRGQITVEAPQL